MKFLSYVSKVLFHIYAILALAILFITMENQARSFNAFFTIAKAQAVAIISLMQRMGGA